MANRYWVGGTGNWSDTAHWSATSGGTSGASVPTSADNVYFNASSFTTTGQIVTVNVTASCLDMDWTGVLYTPTLAGSSTLNIYGNLTTILAMIDSHTGNKNLVATTTGKLLTTNGLALSGVIQTFGVNGEYTLSGDLTLTGGIGKLSIFKGSFKTGNFNITCKTVGCTGTDAKNLDLGSSIISCSSGWTFTTVTGLTFNAGISTIKLTGASATFAGGGLTYNNVEFTGTPITVTDSNIFNDLKLTAGTTVNFTAGTTQTVTTLSGDGTSGSLITLQSTTAGSPFTISKASGEAIRSYYSIQDCVASGSATFFALNSTSVSGNTGWVFNALYASGSILGSAVLTGTLAIASSISGSVSGTVTITGNGYMCYPISGSLNADVSISANMYKVIKTGIADNKVTFFISNNTIYMLDGTELYMWSGSGPAVVVPGYVPTGGTAAPPTGGGTILESLNYLTGKKSWKFSANGTSTVYQLPELNIDSVDTVYVNGILKTVTTDYTFDLVAGTITFVSAPTTGVNNVVPTWTKTVSGDRQIITNNQYYGGVYYARYWLFGNPNHKNTRYCSGVTMAGVSDPSYWPKFSDSDVGEYEITDIVTQYNKQLIFTSGDSEASAWYSNEEDYTNPTTGAIQAMFPVYPMNSKFGNIAKGQTQIILNNPFTIDKGVYQWVSTYIMDEKNATRMSKRVQNDLDKVDLTKAITIDWNDKGVYWLCVGSTVWVYNYRTDTWHILSLPHTPTCFMVVNSVMYFGTDSGQIMKFDPTLGTYDGVTIEATWEMGFFNFEVEWLRKFIQRIFVTILPLIKTHVDITYQTDRNGSSDTYTALYALSAFDHADFAHWSFKTSYSPQPFKFKIRAKKIDYFKLILTNNDTDSATVLSITVPSRTGGEVKNRR